jgi:ribonuclease-3
MNKIGKSKGDQKRIDALEALISFRFSDRSQALTALTHRSFLHEHKAQRGIADNERLEFLGDAVLDLAVGILLMRRYPSATEGELSHMRSEIVNEKGLCAIARQLDLGDLLRLGRGEALSGGQHKPSLLADTLEAVFGAIFLEGGIETVLELVERHFQPLFQGVVTGRADGDYKSKLQEWTQAELKVTPCYRLISADGPDHAKCFHVEVEVSELVWGHGTGKSKKEAEQAAAREAFERRHEAPQHAIQPT